MPKSFLKQVLSPDLIRPRLDASGKEAVIRELVGIFAAAGLLRDRAETERVVLDRERVMSTGMEDGIAIPHGKTDCVDHILVGIGLKREGIDFDCVDGQPARIFVITVSPLSKPGPHLRFMAEISRVLRQADVRRDVLAAGSAGEIYDVLVSH